MTLKTIPQTGPKTIPQRWWRCTGPDCGDIRWRLPHEEECWMCGSLDDVEVCHQPMITSGAVVPTWDPRETDLVRLAG